jgi:hypothetical protein
VAAPVLSPRTLGRALLARQGLLERRAVPGPSEVERLVAVHAQIPGNPYVGLWSRLTAFDPEAVSAQVEDGRLVRSAVPRGTVHMLTARDWATLWPLTAPVLAKSFASAFGRGLAGAPLDEVVAAGTALLTAAPRRRGELSRLLGERWPQADPDALGYAVTHHAPVVQLPPRGTWAGRGGPVWALGETWAPVAPDPAPDPAPVVLRFLRAYGPATAADLRTWSRWNGMREVLARLRPQLRAFRDERGRELLDVEDGLLPDPETPAPPRLLPEYDDALLAHEDRSRTMAGPAMWRTLPPGGTRGTVLVDGVLAGTWVVAEADGAATLALRAPEAAAEEAEALLAFLHPSAAHRRVVLSAR